MPVLDIADAAFLDDEEMRIFMDSVGRFFDQKAPEKRVQKWREDG